jgi:hypothetical protein
MRKIPGGTGPELFPACSVTRLGKPFSEQDLARAIATARHR